MKSSFEFTNKWLKVLEEVLIFNLFIRRNIYLAFFFKDFFLNRRTHNISIMLREFVFFVLPIILKLFFIFSNKLELKLYTKMVPITTYISVFEFVLTGFIS